MKNPREEFTKGQYKINEIFSSIQGEGKYTGHPATFLRFSVCNLECLFCDTDFDDYKLMSKEEILSECLKLENRIIVCTGGEPTLQLDNELVRLLFENNFQIHIETNGSMDLLCDIEMIDHISMSPKQAFKETVLEVWDDCKILFPYFDEINPEDFIRVGRNVRIQPIEDKYYKDNLNGAIEECKKHGYILSIQVHKFIEVE